MTEEELEVLRLRMRLTAHEQLLDALAPMLRSSPTWIAWVHDWGQTSVDQAEVFQLGNAALSDLYSQEYQEAVQELLAKLR